MYRALGLGELGASLSCQRDFALAQGFNPSIELTRTQTIMGGAPYCDFRFLLAGKDSVDCTPQPAPQKAPASESATAEGP